MKTMTATTTAPDPCAWDIALAWDEDGRLDAVSVTRTDGLPFVHPEWAIGDHVRDVLTARHGFTGRLPPPSFVRGGLACVILD